MPNERDDMRLGAFDSIQLEMPDADHLASIAAQMQSSLRPVRPFPSRPAVVALSFLLFAVFAVAAAMPFGYGGFHRFQAVQRMLDYGVVAVLALLFSISLDQQIVPGSKARMSPSTAILTSLAALCAVTLLLFPQVAMRDFVARGVPCLRLGLIVSAVGGVVGWVFARKGYATSPARAGAVLGSFAGLAGVAVLALHCAIQNGPHVLLWHLGTYVIAAVTGALIGLRRRFLRTETHP
jgi:hypothetical protein